VAGLAADSQHGFGGVFVAAGIDFVYALNKYYNIGVIMVRGPAVIGAGSVAGQ
jgi:hypothetical protein